MLGTDVEGGQVGSRTLSGRSSAPHITIRIVERTKMKECETIPGLGEVLRAKPASFRKIKARNCMTSQVSLPQPGLSVQRKQETTEIFLERRECSQSRCKRFGAGGWPGAPGVAAAIRDDDPHPNPRKEIFCYRDSCRFLHGLRDDRNRSRVAADSGKAWCNSRTKTRQGGLKRGANVPINPGPCNPRMATLPQFTS